MNWTTTITTVLALGVAAPAWAVDATEQITTASPSETAASVEARTPAVPASPAESVSPVAEAPVDTPDPAAFRRVIGRELESVRDELEYREGRIRRKVSRVEMSAASTESVDHEISRALDRVEGEIDRIRPAHDTVVEDLDVAHEWIERAADDLEEAGEGADTLATEALSESADELHELADAVEDARDRIEDARERLMKASSDTTSGTSSTSSEGPSSVSLSPGGMQVDGNERVHFGGGVHVKEGETVDEAVAFGGPVRIDGTVDGDAVAFGGNLDIGPTGVVRGDAVSFGGRVNVADGGVIKGEKVAMGMIPQGIFSGDHAFGPRLPWSARLGMRLVKMVAWFLVLFVLTLVTFAVAPRRMQVVVDTLETRPFASGGFGALGSVGIVLLAVLLVVTIIGIILVPPLGVVVTAAIIMGYAALAMIIGRHLPVPVRPSNAAYAALGAFVIVVVANLIPVLGPLVFFTAGFVGLGAVLITKFGSNGESKPGFEPDDPDAYEQAAQEVNDL